MQTYYIHIYVYNAYVCMYTFISICMHTCIVVSAASSFVVDRPQTPQILLCIYIRMCVCVCVRACMHVHIHIFICISMCVYIGAVCGLVCSLVVEHLQKPQLLPYITKDKLII